MHRGEEASQGDTGMAKRNCKNMKSDCHDSARLHTIGVIRFDGLRRRQVLSGAIWGIDGRYFYNQASLAQTQHFFQKKRVRDRGIPAQQIRDARLLRLGARR